MAIKSAFETSFGGAGTFSGMHGTSTGTVTTVGGGAPVSRLAAQPVRKSSTPKSTTRSVDPAQCRHSLKDSLDDSLKDSLMARVS
jgi:hypothetical protein